MQEEFGSFPRASRREVLRAGGALALGGLVAGCATATGINPAVPPAARLIQDRTQIASTPATAGAAMPLEAQEKPTYVAETRDPLAYSRADALFWNDIMMEHSKFFVMLLPGAELAAERREAEQFERTFADLLRQSSGIARDNFVAFNRRCIAEARRLSDWKKRMQQRQTSAQIHSLVWPLFFQHTAREADRFAARLEQYNRGSIELDRAEVVDFWGTTMGEHSGFIAHLLDPNERLLIDQASKLERSFLRKDFREVPGDEVMKAAREVLDFKTVGEKGIRNGHIKSIIHPSLAAHVRREAVRFIDELQRT